ncbi:MAG TPA: rhomboid family intramembrane serine protease [Rhizomicrobium sp.]|jgi:rhomboid protease GluP|nr:rhomboid family intramembrane serine protease [Rhizomicrobium sp.]
MATTFGKRAAPAYAAAAPVMRQAYAAAPGVVQPAITRGPAIALPLVTPLLLVVLTVVFVLEVRHAPLLGGGYAISGRTLAAYGALDGNLLFHSGEWWRLFTAPLLHASAGHLIGNVVVLAIVGFMLEPLIGPRWFAGLYAVGGLGGALGSALLNPGNLPSVGASGAIMGVLGAAFICGASSRAGPKGRKMQTWALRLMLPALIPLAADSHTDFACHLGGVVSGLALGAVLLVLWPRGEERPAFAGVGAGLGAAGLFAAALAFVFAVQPGNAAVAEVAAKGLIPEAQLPQALAVDADTARDLLQRYPHDPRAHLFRGFSFLKDDHDLADAEEQFREALATRDLLSAELSPDFARTVTVLLALTVAYERRPDEARALGAPLCAYAAAKLDDLYSALQDKQICT